MEAVLEEPGASANSPLLYANCCRCYRHLALLDPEAKRALVVWMKDRQNSVEELLKQICSLPDDAVPDAEDEEEEKNKKRLSTTSGMAHVPEKIMTLIN